MKTNPLRGWRLAHNKRALDVAIKIGVSEQSVLQYERGAFKPTRKHFEMIADLMGEDLAKLNLTWKLWEATSRGA
jgi:transcriptional regulator with XRE-family HTH domain